MAVLTSTQVIHPVSRSEWLAHLREVKNYSFFQAPAWCEALCRFQPRFKDSTTMFLLDGQKVLLPAVSVRKTPLLATLESMPWGTYGGWLSTRILRPQQEYQCLRALLSISRPQILIVSWPGTAITAVPDRYATFETHRLDLTPGFDQIWKHRYLPRHRTKISKAERSGLEAVIDNSSHGVQTYKRLYRESMKRWQGDLAFDPDFLDQWIEAPREQVSVWLCQRHGEVLAGALIFYSPVEAHFWSGAFDIRFSEFHPNNFLLNRTIQDAIERGCQAYNFGSSAGLRGVIQFKEQFGPDRITYRRSVYMHPLWRHVDAIRTRMRG